jgi:glucokinase
MKTVGAVDIGGTKIAVGIVDENGRLLCRLESPTEGTGPYAKALERTCTMLHEAEQRTGTDIAGIGIGSTGPVYPFTGEFGDVNFFPNWRGENLVRDLEKEFHVSAAIENDADAAALAEAGWGAGKNKARLIYVTVGTGIGAGIILDGHVYRGVDQAHPEIGHYVIDPSGPLCDCGFHGCWESLAAGPAITAWMRKNAPADYAHRSDLSAKNICRLAQAGDELARRAVEREAYYLGLGIANLVTLLVPDAIVLSGSVLKSAALFLPTIQKIIAGSCRFVPFEKTEIAMASLGDDTNLIGAGRVWFYRFGTQAVHG